MRIEKHLAGDIVYEHDGPPRAIIADVRGGATWIVWHDHPEDDEGAMRRAAKLLRENHQRHAPGVVGSFEK